MKQEEGLKRIILEDVAYVREDSIESSEPAEKYDDMEYVLVRSRDSGVHAGYLKEKKDGEVTLIKSRRIWSWEGAATLSQMAEEGTKKPNKCKFSMEQRKIIICNWCEIADTTKKAQKSIQEVPEWKE